MATTLNTYPEQWSRARAPLRLQLPALPEGPAPGGQPAVDVPGVEPARAAALTPPPQHLGQPLELQLRVRPQVRWIICVTLVR